MKENSLSPYKMESACENEALCQELSDSGRFKLRASANCVHLYFREEIRERDKNE